MEPGVICSAVVPHTPRMAVEETAPEFLKGVIAGEKEFSRYLEDHTPDVIVVQSTHWVCTFNWYATTQQRHQGFCVGEECPDMIPGLAYDRPGDPEFAAAIVAAASDEGIPFFKNETPHFVWDYGSYVPMNYLDPKQTIAMVMVPTCLSADFDECAKVGQIIDKAARKLGRRAMFISSSAFAHKLSRGPELWPTQERQDMDHKMIAMLCAGEIAEAKAWLPDYARDVYAEGGGRTIATMLGTIDETSHSYSGRQFGAYGQSSGSGNATVAIWRQD